MERISRLVSSASSKCSTSHLEPSTRLVSPPAVTPIAKQKHFLVSRVIEPDLPTDPIVSLEIEAVFSKATQVIAWRELQDDSVWRQGWV